MTRRQEFETTDKLWKLVEIAIKDVDDCVERGIEIDMGRWVSHDGWTTCSVCLGGAVLHSTYGINELEYLVDIDGTISFGIVKHKIRALNAIRCGELSKAYYFLQKDLSESGRLPSGLLELEQSLNGMLYASSAYQLAKVRELLPKLKELDI